MSANPDSDRTSFRWRGENFFGSLRRRVLASIAAPIGWVSFVLLYLAFWAHAFTLFQSIVIMVVSLLVLFGLFVAGMMLIVMRWHAANQRRFDTVALIGEHRH